MDRTRFLLPYLLLGLFVSFPLVTHASGTPHWVHYKLLLHKRALPRKVVVFPTNVDVVEVTAGGVKEKVPEWSAKADRIVYRAVANYIRTNKRLHQVALPRISGGQESAFMENLALYKLVVNTATSVGWRNKIRRFDYTIGPGLDFIRRETGADAAVIVFGQDYVSTAGRKAKAIAGNIPIVSWFSGPPPELGHTYIHVGIVDLRTGDLLWLNSKYEKGSSSLRDAKDVKEIVDTIFSWYPGIKRYRRAYDQ